MLDALRQAVTKHRPGEGLLHHSDRGVQYASNAYKAELKKKRYDTEHVALGRAV